MTIPEAKARLAWAEEMYGAARAKLSEALRTVEVFERAVTDAELDVEKAEVEASA